MSRAPLEIDEARRLVLERIAPLGAEPVALAQAPGRVLASDAAAAEPVPGFDSSAMDGYAVRAADTAGASFDRPIALAVVDESRAGHPAGRAIAPGEAISISTGAMVPQGADAVVRVEDTDGGVDRVGVRAVVSAGRDVRRAGEDIEAGATVLRAGSEIGPVGFGVLASLGLAQVPCAKRPRVTVLVTGDELQPPGEPLRPGAIRNSNAYTLAALARRCGAAVTEVEPVPDQPAATRAALAAALESDLAVVTGGVSVGRHDHVRPALDQLGVEQVFWRVALRPGGPTYFGVRPGGAAVLGLPGNPVSAVVTFLLFARPAIRAMLGARDGNGAATARLAEELATLESRTQLVRCRLELTDQGWLAHPTGPQGSHVLTSLLDADALAVVPPGDRPLPAGTPVRVETLPR